MGPDLMDKMQAQAEKFGATVEYEDAVELDLEGDIKTVRTESATYRAKSVILALGLEYKKLGSKMRRNTRARAFYCATCDGFFFKDKEIVVVGGGDSAATEALS